MVIVGGAKNSKFGTQQCHWQSIASIESGKYNSIIENFIILIIDDSKVTIQNCKFSNNNHG